MEDVNLLLYDTTRDSIKKILSDFTSVLAGKKTTVEDLEKLQRSGNNLIGKLAELKRIKPQISRFRITPRKTVPCRSRNLEIDYNLKSDIVKLLQQNLDFAIKYSDISRKIKAELIKENDLGIEELESLQLAG